MRLPSLLIFCLLSFITYAQEANSLLWEISGNGLEKSSYLYGTMHVSKKIAFRLDDVFYEALDKSELVALESDPGQWLENNHIGNNFHGAASGFVSKGFYAHSFRVDNPRKELLAAYLAYEDRIVNTILYRTNEFSQNFEEETYLDMFIYQAGKKFDKPIIALEDMEESATLVGRASMNAMKEKPDEWLQKKMQQQDPMFLLQDAYRERNIALLDSIDRAMYTDHYMKNMLHIRNVNMAHKLDSVMHQGKVFAGIGAAHLPGEEGVIALLRDKGYTIAPLVSKASAKGKSLKQKFEEKTRENRYTIFGPEDGFFTLSLPNKLYPVSELGKTTYISPDLANGSFVVVNRIPTYSFLKKDAAYAIEDIDKLLFENIPGKIIQKTSLEKNGFQGIDIKNVLKNGDHQRYQIFQTPLEILIIKIGGEGDYVNQVSDTIFNSLKFKQSTLKKEMISSDFKDFEIQMPDTHSFTNKSRNGRRMIQGYDQGTDTYYFLKKSVLNDFAFIESDTFELKQIQRRFYQDLDLNAAYEPFNGNKLISSAVLDSVSDKRLYLMTTVRGGEYYLLGTVTQNASIANEFFDSFQLKKATYKEPFVRIIDTALYFSTISTVKPPRFVESSNSYYVGAPETKPHDPFHKKTVYRNKNDEAITVELNKFHDFLMFRNLDSAWAMRKKLYAHKRFNIVDEEARTSPNGHELQFTLTDTASTRGILVKNIIKNGLLYELKAVVNTLDSPSRFVKEFFENFEPKDTIIGRNILEDKVSEFFTALRQGDKIVLDGYRYIKFDKNDVDSLKHYISEFDFDRDTRNIQTHLIQELAQLDDLPLTAFYTDFYTKSYNNSSAQAKVLQVIAQKRDKASAKLLLELMETDLPLLSNTLEINLIFRPYRDSLPLANELFPKLLDFSTISEYKAPIFSLLAKLQARGIIKPKVYKKIKMQILNDAKIKLKRQFAKDLQSTSSRRHTSRYNRENTQVLEDYVTLLYPFKKEREVQNFYALLEQVRNPEIRTTYAALLAENGIRIENKELTELAADINSRLLLFTKLREGNLLNLFPEKFRSQKWLSEALLYQGGAPFSTKDSVAFVGEKELGYNGKKLTGYYFKKRNTDDYHQNFNMHLLVFENGKGLQTKPYYENEGMRIEDTDTDTTVIEYVTEEFLLKDRQRAQVNRPNGYGGGYGFHH